ncbi:hypothetical protein [Candidatus Ferrigenium straubiae]|jgi:hypothetical protein|uniref:hypothetical protein n=1 Tax=Candidatus Ferrigenium straubiae TaxID=2919506 RepID=UPI003F4AA7FC
MTGAEYKEAEHPKLNGEVWIDGKRIYSGLTPRIGESGLRIDRLKYNKTAYFVEHEGPHFGFTLITTFLLTSLTTEDLSKGASFTFSGPYLGGTMMRGHSHGGIGPLVRHITHLNFYICIRQEQFYFEFSGKTGELLPWSYNNPIHSYPRSPQEFKVWFYLTKELIPSLKKHEGFINAMAGKLKSC